MTPDPHESAYAGLHGGDDTHWAFGTDVEDPLAGMDTTVPSGVDPAALAGYCLMLGDDALIFSQRLAQWCSRAPDLEEDIALANIALDLLGQARLLLTRAAVADPRVVPVLPQGSPVPPEDALAFFRDESQFRNVRLVEIENGDFADIVVRLVLLTTWRLALFCRVEAGRDPVLAAIGAKGVKELTYHRDYAARWFVTLGRGTATSRARLVAALDRVWPFADELATTHEIEQIAAAQGFGADPATVAAEVDEVLGEVFARGGVRRPQVPAAGRVLGGAGRNGRHTESMGLLLAELQVVARAHPLGRW